MLKVWPSSTFFSVHGVLPSCFISTWHPEDITLYMKLGSCNYRLQHSDPGVRSQEISVLGYMCRNDVSQQIRTYIHKYSLPVKVRSEVGLKSIKFAVLLKLS